MDHSYNGCCIYEPLNLLPINPVMKLVISSLCKKHKFVKLNIRELQYFCVFSKECRYSRYRMSCIHYITFFAVCLVCSDDIGKMTFILYSIVQVRVHQVIVYTLRFADDNICFAMHSYGIAITRYF